MLRKIRKGRKKGKKEKQWQYRKEERQKRSLEKWAKEKKQSTLNAYLNFKIIDLIVRWKVHIHVEVEWNKILSGTSIYFQCYLQKIAKYLSYGFVCFFPAFLFFLATVPFSSGSHTATFFLCPWKINVEICRL